MFIQLSSRGMDALFVSYDTAKNVSVRQCDVLQFVLILSKRGDVACANDPCRRDCTAGWLVGNSLLLIAHR